MAIELGLIGGTGLYAFPGLQHATRVEIDTSYGAPSGAYVCGELDGHRVAFDFGRYDRERALHVDPYLARTYHGGTADEFATEDLRSAPGV